MLYHRELDLALDIAKRAGDVALQYSEGYTETLEKSDLSPVTIADRECEKIISRCLAEHFPDDGIMGEEGAFVESRSGRRWLIDPIDGTRDFVRRSPFWSVQIGLQDHGKMVLGIINLPGQKEVFYAVKGQECYWNDSVATCSNIKSLDKAVLMVSGFRDAWNSWGPQHIRALTEQCWTVRAYGGCYDVTMIARGKADIWLSGAGMEWDYAPAVVIAEECGARFLTRDGSNRIDARHALICTAELESSVCELLGIPRSPAR